MRLQSQKASEDQIAALTFFAANSGMVDATICCKVTHFELNVEEDDVDPKKMPPSLDERLRPPDTCLKLSRKKFITSLVKSLVSR